MGRRDGVRARLGSSSSPARSSSHSVSVKSFFLTDPSTTASYALSLHDALPISDAGLPVQCGGITVVPGDILVGDSDGVMPDRKSTRLNSSHMSISYAVFCLKKKKRDICQSILCRDRLMPPEHRGDQRYSPGYHC